MSDAGERTGPIPPGERVHGGADLVELAALGLSPDPGAILDFSVNVSPYGVAPEMEAAVRAAPLGRYPDPRGWAARRALGERWGVAPERVALGNGAADLLFALVRELAGGGRTLLTVEPTFSEPAAAARAAGARLVSWRASAEDGFAVDVGAVAALARQRGAAAVYLCNPQNPTGRALPAAEVAGLARDLGDTLLLLDEAFLALSTRWADADVPLPGNVVRVRSFTKEHALPGLRVGALLGPPALVERLEATRPIWAVGTPAQAALAAAAGLDGFVAGVRARWLADTAALAQELVGAGLGPRPSDTVFLLLPVPDAAELRLRLLREQGLLVRACGSFGLPGFVRLSGRPAADRRRLLAALSA